MTNIARELQRVWRSIRRQPGHAVLATTILACALGLAMYMFGAIQAYVLSPLPYPDSAHLYHVEYERTVTPKGTLGVPLHDYLDLRDRQRSFERLAAFRVGTVNLSGSERPERYDGAFLTSNVFDVVRVSPALGRGFVPADCEPGAAPVVVIGHDVWIERFRRSSGIIGTGIRVNSRAATIVGVMPEGFYFAVREQVWVPMSLGLTGVARGETPAVDVIGRLRIGVTPASARAGLKTITDELVRLYPETNTGLVPVVKTYAEEFVDSGTRRALYTMFATVLLVLLVAALFTTVPAGALPAFRAAGADVNDTLRAGGRGLAGTPLGRLSRILVIGEIGLACVVLICAGLMVRSLVKLDDRETGADTGSVLTGRIGLFEGDYPAAGDRAEFLRRLEERLTALPGVETATLSTSLPGTICGATYYAAEGQGVEPGRRPPVTLLAAISPSDFSAFGIPILDGRGLMAADDDAAPPVIVVNSTMAAEIADGGQVLGRRMRLAHPDDPNAPLATIVGIVPDVLQQAVNEPVFATVYLPIAQAPPRLVSLALRTVSAGRQQRQDRETARRPRCPPAHDRPGHRSRHRSRVRPAAFERAVRRHALGPGDLRSGHRDDRVGGLGRSAPAGPARARRRSGRDTPLRAG
jgi:hypothetical protein